MRRSPNHGTNNGRASEPQAIPPCKPPPSRPPVTPNSIDEVSSGFHVVGNNSVNNSNNNNSTPTNVSNSNNSHNLATPTARQTKPVRTISHSVSVENISQNSENNAKRSNLQTGRILTIELPIQSK